MMEFPGDTETRQGRLAAGRLVGSCDDPDRVTKTGDPLEGGAQQGISPGRQGQQMLRRGPAAERPQARAAATRQHEDMEAHVLTCRLSCD